MQIRSRAARPLLTLALAALVLGRPASAGAQDLPDEVKPIGRFVADARVGFPKFKQAAVTADGIGVAAANLPTRAFGLVFGAHWYPARLGIVTFGLGGEMIVARRGRTLETGAAAAPVKVTVNSRFSSLAPQISFNFGTRNGWSYISGGIGSSTFTAERQDTPLPDQVSRSKTINYGGGARWFAKKHLAMSVDLRFYAVNPEDPTAVRPARPRMTLMAFNVGMAVR